MCYGRWRHGKRSARVHLIETTNALRTSKYICVGIHVYIHIFIRIYIRMCATHCVTNHKDRKSGLAYFPHSRRFPWSIGSWIISLTAHFAPSSFIFPCPPCYCLLQGSSLPHRYSYCFSFTCQLSMVRSPLLPCLHIPSFWAVGAQKTHSFHIQATEGDSYAVHLHRETWEGKESVEKLQLSFNKMLVHGKQISDFLSYCKRTS